MVCTQALWEQCTHLVYSYVLGVIVIVLLPIVHVLCGNVWTNAQLMNPLTLGWALFNGGCSMSNTPSTLPLWLLKWVNSDVYCTVSQQNIEKLTLQFY